MKMRMGFVSNSSSSSFVLLGYLLPKSEYSAIDVVQKVFSVSELDKAAQKCCKKNWGECIEEELIDAQYYIRNTSSRIMSNTDDGAPDDDTIVVGKLLGVFSNEDCAEPEVEDFSKYLSEVQEIGKKLGVDNIQLISGTFAS